MQEFKLLEPLEIKNQQGEVISSYDTIYLFPPLNKHRNHSMMLRNIFKSATLEISNVLAKSQVNTEVTKEEANVQLDNEIKKKEEVESLKALAETVLTSSSTLDIQKLNNTFDNIVSETCYLDNDKTKKVSKIDINLLSIEDYCNLQLEYISLFFLSSWMKALT